MTTITTKKLIILGLDGVSFNVLETLFKESNMPTLHNLVRESIARNLKSTIPPTSAGAWTALATGLDICESKIYDFFIVDSTRRRLKPVSLTLFRGRLLWDILGGKGVKVGVFNYPLLYPPYSVNGFMVSGFTAPRDDNIFYPRILGLELKKVIGGKYRVHLNYHNPKYDDLNVFFNDLFELLDIKAKALEYLLYHKKWDFFISVISCTDFALHVAWRLIDPAHPFHDKREYREFYSRYLNFWSRVDKIVDTVKKATEEVDGELLIVSDHGFQAQTGIFNILKFLVDNKYTKLRFENKLIRKARSLIYKFAYSRLGMRLALALPTRIRRSLIRSTGYDVSSIIDFNNSIAYTLNNTMIFAPIYINYEVLRKHKLDYKDVVENIVKDLNIMAERLGIRIDTYRIDHLCGRVDPMLPDIIVSVNNWSTVFIKDTYGKLYHRDKCLYKRFSGTHSLYGVFIAHGLTLEKIMRRYRVELAINEVYDIVLRFYNIGVKDF